ncbi:MAG: leucyl/phenylalanyl-tRNA--protein transferase [Desulfobacterales bacterium]|nr:leucyl/phenylalanyl-tRNA--protein transferase [Desulfobacterales bacterium]
MTIFSLSKNITFPPPKFADKSGLLAVGGDLSIDRLLLAYKMGIFPWYSDNEPILWWSPDPRFILIPNEITISKSLKKVIKKKQFTITMDNAFKDVIMWCANIRTLNGQETWLVNDMIKAYLRLHKAGYAHSVEAWLNNELVGGLYGVSLGKCFFGESMFTRVSNASKIAFAHFVEHLQALSFDLIDCQIKTEHLKNFGAKPIQRETFLNLLQESLKYPTYKGKWKFIEGEI